MSAKLYLIVLKKYPGSGGTPLAGKLSGLALKDDMLAPLNGGRHGNKGLSEHGVDLWQACILYFQHSADVVVLFEPACHQKACTLLVL